MKARHIKRRLDGRRKNRRIRFKSVWQFGKGVIAFAERIVEGINNENV